MKKTIVRFIKHYMNHPVGEVAGYTDKAAKALISKGYAEKFSGKSEDLPEHKAVVLKNAKTARLVKSNPFSKGKE